MDDKSLKKIIAKVVYDDGKAFLEGLEKSQAQKKPNYNKWLIAASIVVLLGIGSFVALQNRISSSAENLYAEYFSPYPNNYKPVVRGQTDEKTVAFIAYENKNYDKATHLFSKLLLENEDNSIRFYYAISLLSQDKPEIALKELNKLEPLEFHYKKQVLWYKGLALLKTNKTENAKQTFKELKTTFSNYNSKEVTEILKRLK